MEKLEMLLDKKLCELRTDIIDLKRMLNELLSLHQSKEVDRVLDVNELAAMLNLDKHIIYAKCGSGEIPFFKIGNKYKFKKSEVMNWLKNQTGENKISTDDYVNRYLQSRVLRT